MVIGLIIFLIIFIILLCLYFTLAVSIHVYWCWQEEEQYLHLSCHTMRIPLYSKRVDFHGLPSDVTIHARKILQMIQYVRQHAKHIQVQSETVVSTSDPAVTAYLYVFLKVVTEWLRSLHQADNKVAADFEQTAFQTEGECMISLSLRQNIKELNKWRKEFSNGRQ
ncbi:hypothetical protein [Gracilibacillus alcaliphilus]|uniref:hypothetical protein n=1 Tax=Gracilibacillus alcaliphilus TaxID=1401441 RepID=UPI0019582609|nr:hypothetical protein [Gracilibacillus alcaliphilus]MBM7676881.1 hypothetical protein [Gracilibacillus alcaliphilus]